MGSLRCASMGREVFEGGNALMDTTDWLSEEGAAEENADVVLRPELIAESVASNENASVGVDVASVREESVSVGIDGLGDHAAGLVVTPPGG